MPNTQPQHPKHLPVKGCTLPRLHIPDASHGSVLAGLAPSDREEGCGVVLVNGALAFPSALARGGPKASSCSNMYRLHDSNSICPKVGAWSTCVPEALNRGCCSRQGRCYIIPMQM